MHGNTNGYHDGAYISQSAEPTVYWHGLVHWLSGGENNALGWEWPSHVEQVCSHGVTHTYHDGGYTQRYADPSNHWYGLFERLSVMEVIFMVLIRPYALCKLLYGSVVLRREDVYTVDLYTRRGRR